MILSKETIILINNIIPINITKQVKEYLTPEKKTKQATNYDIHNISALISNLAYYGYAPSNEAFKFLTKLNAENIGKLWDILKPSLEYITGNSKKSEKYILNENFPFSSSVDKAAYELVDKIKNKNIKDSNLKILSLEKNNSEKQIINNLIAKNNLWNESEELIFTSIISRLKSKKFFIKDFNHKDNILNAVAKDSDITIYCEDANDVLKLAAKMSGYERLSNNVIFRNFSRKERRYLLSLIDSSKNDLLVSFSSKIKLWKKLMAHIHPFDYNYENVTYAAHELYNDRLNSINSIIDSYLKSAKLSIKKNNIKYFNNESYLSLVTLLSSNPKIFLRRFHELYNVFGETIGYNLIFILDKIDTLSLIKLKKYINNINDIKELIYNPNGNPSKSKIIPNKKHKLTNLLIEKFNNEINSILKVRVSKKFKNGVFLDGMENVLLGGNLGGVTKYTEGTVIKIPNNIKILRTLTHWKTKESETRFIDNTINYISSDFKSLGTSCWNSEYDGAKFSGDKLNTDNKDNKASQFIDLNIDLLKKSNVRYAIWSILSWDNLEFSSFEEIFSSIQICEDDNSSNLYDPKRNLISFSLKNKNKNRTIAIIDIVEMSLIVVDRPFNRINVNSGIFNEQEYSDLILPAYLDSLKLKPSVKDLFENNIVSSYEDSSVPLFLYDDTNFDISKNKAFVLFPQNKNNNYEKLSLNNISKI